MNAKILYYTVISKSFQKNPKVFYLNIFFLNKNVNINLIVSYKIIATNQINCYCHLNIFFKKINYTQKFFFKIILKIHYLLINKIKKKTFIIIQLCFSSKIFI